LIDGLDGLLSSVGIVVSLAMAAMAVLCGHGAAACVAVALAGSLLGFLCYNFPPASIFLGDSGSMLIGLVVGVLAIQASLKAPATIALAAPVAALTIPILDTMAAIIRRKLTGRSIYETDRGHLHHCLLKRGLSNRGVLLCVSLFSLATAGGALVSLALKNELFAILSGFAVIVVLVASRLFGYVEFLLLRDRIVATGAWFLGRRTQTAPVETTVRLQGSADWAELWGTLTDCATRHQLKVVRLDVNAPSLGEAYHAEWNCLSENEENNSQVWWAEVPLRALGQTIGRLQLVGQRNRGSAWSQIASVADSLEGLEDAVTALAAAPKSRSGVAARAGLMAGPVAVASSVLDGAAVEANRALTASDSDIAIEALA
jgi:UDP-GlcNAc:undecaprenyl-phosphate/decaprenyl-phosphate GlcNAc-1-phosphate transferase